MLTNHTKFSLRVNFSNVLFFLLSNLDKKTHKEIKQVLVTITIFIHCNPKHSNKLYISNVISVPQGGQKIRSPRVPKKENDVSFQPIMSFVYHMEN